MSNFTRRNSISLRTNCRNVRDLVLTALEDNDRQTLERLAAFEDEIRSARDALDAILGELDEADDLEANVQTRTPPIVSRRTS